MQTATNGDVTLAYELTGPDDAPVVAFVEGLGYARWMWNWQVEALDDLPKQGPDRSEDAIAGMPRSR